MEREKIIKALECCSKDDCDNCPNTFGNCYSNLSGYALALINELINEADNCKAVAEYQQSSNMSRGFELREKDRENNRLIREIDRLNEELETLKKQLDDKCDRCIERDRADTVKKMQERLREAPIKVGLPLFGLQTKGEVEDYANELILQMRDAIDQIAKEMLEGTDERE